MWNSFNLLLYYDNDTSVGFFLIDLFLKEDPGNYGH